MFRHVLDVVAGHAGAIYEVMRYGDVDRPERDVAEREFAAAWRRQPKWVASRTLASVGPNATLKRLGRRNAPGTVSSGRHHGSRAPRFVLRGTGREVRMRESEESNATFASGSVRLAKRELRGAVLLVSGCAALSACGTPNNSLALPMSRLTSMANDETGNPSAPPVPIRVRVVDAAGRGVADAAVQVCAHWALQRGPDCGVGGENGVASGRSGADGTFSAGVRFADCVNGVLAAAVAGDASGTSPYLAWTPGGAEPSELVVALAPGRFVTGRVTLAGGAPAAGLDIVCTWSGNAFELRTTTGSGGRFRIGPVPADAAQDDARLDARGPSSAIWYVEVGRIRSLPAGTDVQMCMPPEPVLQLK